MAIFWSGEEIVHMAVQIEKNGVAFYRSLAESSKDDKMRGLMEYLAGEEERHAATFERFSDVRDKEQLKDLYDIRYAEEASLYLKALADTKVFTDSSEAVQWAKEARSTSEILLTAIALEKDSILFYQEMRNFVRNQDRDLVDRIINEEKKHIRTLAKVKEEYLFTPRDCPES